MEITGISSKTTRSCKPSDGKIECGHNIAKRYGSDTIRVCWVSHKKYNENIAILILCIFQCIFFRFILLKPHFTGVQVSRENFEDITHFWRVIGHMIGIEDEFNLMTDCWATTKPRLEIVCNEVYRPFLSSTTPDFHTMGDALLTGMWCFNPVLNTDAFLYYVKMACGCPNYLYLENNLDMFDSDAKQVNKLREMNWYARLILFLQYSIHVYLLNFSWIRWYMNMQIHISMAIIRWFPFLAIYYYGYKKAYLRILGESYNILGNRK